MEKVLRVNISLSLKAPSLIPQSDKDQYQYLLSIVDPGKRTNPDEEALLAVCHLSIMTLFLSLSSLIIEY